MHVVSPILNIIAFMVDPPNRRVSLEEKRKLVVFVQIFFIAYGGWELIYLMQGREQTCFFSLKIMSNQFERHNKTISSANNEGGSPVLNYCMQ